MILVRGTSSPLKGPAPAGPFYLRVCRCAVSISGAERIEMEPEMENYPSGDPEFAFSGAVQIENAPIMETFRDVE